MDSTISKRKTKRKSPAGRATNDLVFSAHDGTNVCFPRILSLFVELGSTVIPDITVMVGEFSAICPPTAFKLLKSDIRNGDYCRKLPYANGSIDCVGVRSALYAHSWGHRPQRPPEF